MSALVLLNKIPLNGIKAQKGVLLQCLNVIDNRQPNRGINKHWNPKFKWLRTKKVIEVDLPNFHEKEEDISEEERKKRMRERGLSPPRPWSEKPFFLASTSTIFEPYIPPEGDGKMSQFSIGGQKQNLDFLGKKSTSMMAIRKIRQYEEDFKPATFAQTAQDIYIKANEMLMEKDKENISEYVTERLYPEILFNTKNVTIRWKFLKSIEPPRVVHVRQTHLISKENLFAQVTVRMHTQQTLAIYDRFGRLMHGSEIIAKDVLEYVVFEKNISNMYGEWRMHDKIIPSWAEPKQPSIPTYRYVEPKVEEEPAEEEVQQPVEAVQLEDGNQTTTSVEDGNQKTPTVAPA